MVDIGDDPQDAMRDDLQKVEPKEIEPAVEQFSTELMAYLEFLALPKKDVLVAMDERSAVINNLPSVVSRLSAQQREAAMYISKLVAACSVGLFDAALNYLWDETIRNLRQKIVQFDLEYFYASVIRDPDNRVKFNSEADLEKLEDWKLILGCRQTGLITELGFKHLDYIRDMRNWASAAHPNHNQLSGLQLASWLETCIKEVLAKEPEGPVIEVRKLLQNVREQKLSELDLPLIELVLPNLSTDLADSLLQSIMGMYSDLKISTDVRNNIKIVASAIWKVCPEESKYQSGMKLATLQVNGDVGRAKLAREFLEIVNGVTYLPAQALAMEISIAVDVLLGTHRGLNNFYNEPAPARMLQRVIPANGKVPKGVLQKYVKALVMCTIGNGYGVSWAAEPIYDDLLSRLDDEQIYRAADLVHDPEVSSRLQFKEAATRFQQLCGRFKGPAVRPRLKDALDFLSTYQTQQIKDVKTDPRFQEKWNRVTGT